MKNFNETQAGKTILRIWYFSFAETGQSAYCRSARFPSGYTGICQKQYLIIKPGQMPERTLNIMEVRYGL